MDKLKCHEITAMNESQAKDYIYVLHKELETEKLRRFEAGMVEIVEALNLYIATKGETFTILDDDF